MHCSGPTRLINNILIFFGSATVRVWDFGASVETVTTLFPYDQCRVYIIFVWAGSVHKILTHIVYTNNLFRSIDSALKKLGTLNVST